MSHNQQHPLAPSLVSLQSSVSLLSSSLNSLSSASSAISDLPRLTHVLQQKRHFELLPASSISEAQQALIEDITPEIESLIARCEKHVDALERKEASLRAKWELQEGRLGRDVAPHQRGASFGKASGSAGKKSVDKVGDPLGPKDEMKIKQLRMKKDRLSYAVERLTLQAQTTERKLRMSMAAQDIAQKPQEEKDDSIEF